MAKTTNVSAGRSSLLGTPSDWQLRKPSLRPPRLGIHLIGPLAVAASVVLPWFAFASATGDGANVAFGLFIGAASIVLMAWSFVLAIRLRFLEPVFGGLDSMYRVHRWAGTLAVVAMFLHTSVEPEIEGGIRGASRSLADTAEDLAGTGPNHAVHPGGAEFGAAVPVSVVALDPQAARHPVRVRPRFTSLPPRSRMQMDHPGVGTSAAS